MHGLRQGWGRAEDMQVLQEKQCPALLPTNKLKPHAWEKSRFYRSQAKGS